MGVVRTIVVGVDGSAPSQLALDHAASVAKAFGARLLIVTAYQTPSMVLSSAADPLYAGAAAVGGQIEADMAAEAGRHLDGLADGLRADGIDASTLVIASDPASALLDVAESESADLIVVGNKGMRGTKRFLLGSVPSRVAHHAPCSVTIVRTT